jgi:hypothetical protein
VCAYPGRSTLERIGLTAKQDPVNMRGVAADVVARDARRFLEAGFTVEKHVHEGDAAHTLINVAEEKDADMIAVGARGAGALRRFALGSVSAKLSHSGPAAVRLTSSPPKLIATRWGPELTPVRSRHSNLQPRRRPSTRGRRASRSPTFVATTTQPRRCQTETTTALSSTHLSERLRIPCDPALRRRHGARTNALLVRLEASRHGSTAPLLPVLEGESSTCPPGHATSTPPGSRELPWSLHSAAARTQTAGGRTGRRWSAR